jgi:hypothetical protein
MLVQALTVAWIAWKPCGTKRLLTRALELERGRGNDDRVAYTLRALADANRMLGLYEEGIQQSKEALEIYERLGDAEGQAKCWNYLGWLLLDDDNLTPRKKLDPTRSNSFWTKAENIGSADLIVFSVIYISIQGRERESHSTFRGGHRNRIPLRLAPSTVLDSFLPGGAVLR